MKDIPIAEDPGVASVVRIYNYYKKFDYKTQVMGASFRKADQIVELAGCDLLTISPELLAELRRATGRDPAQAVARGRQGHPGRAASTSTRRPSASMHNEDPMAVDKLSDGIRKFYADARKLEKYAETPGAPKPPSGVTVSTKRRDEARTADGVRGRAA